MEEKWVERVYKYRPEDRGVWRVENLERKKLGVLDSYHMNIGVFTTTQHVFTLHYYMSKKIV